MQSVNAFSQNTTSISLLLAKLILNFEWKTYVALNE